MKEMELLDWLINQFHHLVIPRTTIRSP